MFRINKLENWKKKWIDESNITILDYISMNVHPDDILILSSLFFPKIIEVQNFIFLEMNYNPNTLSQWLEVYGKDSISIEKMINHVHVYDIFGHCSDDIDDETFQKVAEVLQYSWTNHCKNLYPTKNIRVELVIDENEYGPTLYVYQI